MLFSFSSLKMNLSRYKKFWSSAWIVCFFEETGEGQFHEIEGVTRVIPSLYLCYSLSEKEHLPFVPIVFSVPFPVKTVSRSSCFSFFDDTFASVPRDSFIQEQHWNPVRSNRKGSRPFLVMSVHLWLNRVLLAFSRIICVHPPDLLVLSVFCVSCRSIEGSNSLLRFSQEQLVSYISLNQVRHSSLHAIEHFFSFTPGVFLVHCF